MLQKEAIRENYLMLVKKKTTQKETTMDEGKKKKKGWILKTRTQEN